MLVHVPLFAALNELGRDAMAAMATWRLYDRGARIVGPGDDQQNMFVVGQGAVRIAASGSEGQEITIFSLTVGDLIDFVDLPPELEELAYAYAARDGTIAFRSPRHDFLRIVRANPAAVDLPFDQARQRVFELALLYTDHLFYDALTRLHRVLSRLAADDPDHVVRATQTELAHMTGMTRETVGRLLPRLKRRGLIAYEPHRQSIRVLETARVKDRPSRKPV